MDYTKDIQMMARRVLETNLLIKERNSMEEKTISEDQVLVNELKEKFMDILEIIPNDFDWGIKKALSTHLVMLRHGVVWKDEYEGKQLVRTKEEIVEILKAFWITKLELLIEKLEEVK